MADDLNRRLGFFVCAIVFALLLLAPTFLKGTIPEQWISRPLALGLDLSGGVHLVYEVQTREAVKGRLQTEAKSIVATLKEAKIAAVRNRVNENNQIEITLLSEDATEKARSKIEEDFKNLAFVQKSTDGGRFVLSYGYNPVTAQKIESDSVVQAVETLRNRVDQFGVAEPLIQKNGEKRILLQMPGIQDIEAVKKAVGSLAKLEFRLVMDGAPGGDGTVTMKNKEGTPIVVQDEPMMTGEAVESAHPENFGGQVHISLKLTTEGARTFRKVTAENVGRRFAIILDGTIYSDPVIREAIPSGQASISGGFTFAEATNLSRVLRAGALPAPLKVLEERTVGPTLGSESIVKGITAIIVGMLGIMTFMIVYYKKSGFVAVGTLFCNMLFLMGLLSAFGATLSLPGLAGLALTIGMAVDANVLIFERIRDELRLGVTRDAAVSSGFDKAFSAIIDANLTTLISAMLLYYFGTGPVRGFAVTLSVGILTTVFSATFISRLAFDALQLEGKNGLSI
jgi:preprotein translocase subunit SecD